MPENSERLAAALRHHQAGNTGEAESIYREVLATEPDNFVAWHLWGTLALQFNKYALAEERLRRALAINPNFVEAHSNLGVVLRSQGQLDQAVACYQKATQLAPDNAEAHFNMGNALKDAGRLDEAIASYCRSLALRPNYVEALGNCGCALRDQGNVAEALALHQQAAELAPLNAQAQFLLGSDFHESGQFELAKDCYRRALELKPDYPEAHLNHSAISLVTGDFESGWREYEWRWKTDQLTERVLSQPPWNGEPLEGKTILLHAEQGAGDNFQFIRYVPLVKACGATVFLECTPRLKNLLAGCSGIDRLIALDESPPPFDTHTPLLSLPRIFRTTLDTIPATLPYLFAKPALVAKWRIALGSSLGVRIGINWQGRPGPPEFRKRDIPLEQFAPLANLPGVRLISLQKNEPPDPIVTRQTGNGSKQQLPLNLVDLGEDLDTKAGAFMDTAAVMMNLDLVLTSDTSIAHLAGALGVPVWLALPYVPDWRWLLRRTDSPWYPTMRLFRQRSPGDWTGVFAEIERELRQRIPHRNQDH